MLCGHSEVEDGVWKGLVIGPTEPEHVISHTPLGSLSAWLSGRPGGTGGGIDGFVL